MNNNEMMGRFTCERVDNAGGTPGFTTYHTTMGAHGTHQLYRNEAEALCLNLMRALGWDRAVREAAEVLESEHPAVYWNRRAAERLRGTFVR